MAVNWTVTGEPRQVEENQPMALPEVITEALVFLCRYKNVSGSSLGAQQQIPGTVPAIGAQCTVD